MHTESLAMTWNWHSLQWSSTWTRGRVSEMTTTTIFHRFRAHTRREVNWLDDWQRPTSTSCEDYRARCFSRFWWRLKINQKHFASVKRRRVDKMCVKRVVIIAVFFALFYNSVKLRFASWDANWESVDLSLFDIDRSALAEVETESKKNYLAIFHCACKLCCASIRKKTQSQPLSGRRCASLPLQAFLIQFFVCERVQKRFKVDFERLRKANSRRTSRSWLFCAQNVMIKSFIVEQFQAYTKKFYTLHSQIIS